MTDTKPSGSSTALSCMPAVVMAVVAVADLVAGPDVGLLPLVSLGPAFAGLVGGWRRTALIGAVALVLCVGLGCTTACSESAGATPRWCRSPA
ncbi:hypothetical protein GCM10027072_67000 [Streptomyces bullii]